MDLTAKDELAAMPDLRHRLRQLRWFVTAFRNNAALVEAHFGLAFRIDEKALNKVFFDWLAAVAAQDELATRDRADYIIFIAGLALRELIRTKPAMLVADTGMVEGADKETLDLARFWPEGFLYTNFCVCAVSAVHEQEFGEPRSLDQAASDLRTWWSFRENVADDLNAAIAFFDRFLGQSPNWRYPTVARERAAIKRVLAERESEPLKVA